ncbi:MarR family winged helix-turn-helix transcriptional regulator [Aliiroseovarius sp. PTFE2010]|uniref:MarR family winged helix-turn-helix transcriptional regulator n=1 Tax=Aliiroseovarius sp. PTFE2010 TaxID=3417190 RepID=UPI003CED2ECB
MQDDPDLMEAFTRSLTMVARQWKRRIDLQFRELGLTQARWGVLLELSRSEEITQTELARSLGIEGATLVRLLDGLEGGGLVERRPCEEDRRAKKLRLTPKASALIGEMKKIATENRRLLLVDVSEQDLQMSTRVLNQILARLEIMNSDKNG